MPTDTNRTQWIIGATVVVVLLLAGWMLMGRSSEVATSANPEAEAETEIETEAEERIEETESETSVPANPVTSSPSGRQIVTAGAQGESVTAHDQPAGMSVQIASMHLTRESWVAVRDAWGRVMGASRFSPGATSGTVRLLRGTEPGQTYAVIIYIDNGDRVFDLYADALVDGINETFVAR